MTAPPKEQEARVQVDLTPEEIVLVRESARRLAQMVADLGPLVHKLNAAYAPHLPTADEISGLLSDDPDVRAAAQERCEQGIAERGGVSEQTARGFDVYVALTDSYRASVSVVESSRAQIEDEDEGPWCWVFVDGGQVTGNYGATLLDPDQARQLRDGLDAWLASVA